MRKLSLLVSVASGLSPYIATTPSGQVVATLHRNTLPREPLTLDYQGQAYRIEHVVASNHLLLNDFRYALVDDSGTLASCIAKPATRTTEVKIGDIDYRLVRRSSWWSMRYALEDAGGRPLGEIVETTGISLWRRKFRGDVPGDIGGPAAMFLFFLAANFRFR